MLVIVWLLSHPSIPIEVESEVNNQNILARDPWQKIEREMIPTNDNIVRSVTQKWKNTDLIYISLERQGYTQKSKTYIINEFNTKYILQKKFCNYKMNLKLIDASAMKE